jgi:Zn finger protein HypA/HybF involved in hydrogenase expression
MLKFKKIELKNEVDAIKFECPKCKDGAHFVLTTDHLNGYGELGCPLCFSKEIRVIFLNYKKVERGN